MTTARMTATNTNNTIDQPIIEVMANYSVDELAALSKISSKQAEVEYKRWQLLDTQTALRQPAIELFDGLMYRAIKRTLLSKEEFSYLEQCVAITTALYGVIPAFYPISEHRLDFMQSIQVAGMSLKNYNRERYNASVEQEELVISLLSSEFEEVFSKEVREQFVKVVFMEEKEGVLKTHSTISKKARGAFVTVMMENQIKTIEEVKQLKVAEFVYRETLSTDHKLVFVKQK